MCIYFNTEDLGVFPHSKILVNNCIFHTVNLFAVYLFFFPFRCYL